MNASYSPRSARALLESVGRRWWVAGGHAIDLFLGRATRSHEDLDVAILRSDEQAFRAFLSNWEFRPSLGEGRLDPTPLRAGDPLPPDREAIWCRPTPQSGWAFELLLNRTDGDDWLFKRNAAIRIPLDQLGLATPAGIPFLRPEVVLLFKAKRMRPRDRQDFDRVVGDLTPTARTWLREALDASHAGHPWIERLER